MFSRPSNRQALTTHQAYLGSMVNKATAAFAFSTVGAAYQLISPYVAALANSNNFSYFYTYGLETLILSSFITFWGASHLVEDWKGRITWPFLIFVLGWQTFRVS